MFLNKKAEENLKQNKINLIWWKKAQMSFIEKVWYQNNRREEKRREEKRKEEKRREEKRRENEMKWEVRMR